MFRISRDPAFINGFINHPEVFPHCGYPPGVRGADASSRVNDRDIVFIHDGKDAMMAMHRVGPCTWEKHNLFRPGCRGRNAIITGRAMLQWARVNLFAAEVVANTPLKNKAARWFNRQIGMKSEGVRPSDMFGSIERFATCL